MVVKRLDPRHWKLVRRAFDYLRARFYTIPGKDPQVRVVDADVDEVRRALGRHHFTNGWELSYSYKGEDGNLRRPLLLEDLEHPWQQDHARLFDDGDDVLVHAHQEPEPTEHPAAHLAAGSQEFDPAVATVVDVLVQEGHHVERVQEGSA